MGSHCGVPVRPGIDRTVVGESDLADAISRCYADTVVTAFGSGGDVFEHNSHEDGRGLGVGRYTWGAAVALVLMEDLDE